MPNQNISNWSGIGGLTIGPLLAAAFYSVLTVLPTPMLHRYFMGHPVAIVATGLFAIAIASLAIKWLEAKRELRILRGLADSEIKPRLSKSADDVTQFSRAWLNHLADLPNDDKRSLLVRRIQEILHRQLRRKTARFLNEDLREISEREADTSHDSFQLVRIIVWAIPMLGFLGTVIGITQTLGGLDFTDAQNAVDKLKAGLYVAFDTTALGLVLSVIAIFIQLPVEKKLTALLGRVDERTIDVFFGAFPDETPQDEPIAVIAEMNKALLLSVGQLVEKQAELWKNTINSAHEHWTSIVGSAGDQVQAAFVDAIDQSLQRHADHLRQVQDESTANVDLRWKQWQTTLSENARVLLAQQQALAEQNELLTNSGNRAAELHELRELFETNLRSLTAFPDMTDAMRALARAIDSIKQPTHDSSVTQKGKAA